jgi:hypothetical protein
MVMGAEIGLPFLCLVGLKMSPLRADAQLVVVE